MRKRTILLAVIIAVCFSTYIFAETEGIQSLRKRAEQGSAEAQYDLGQMYDKGEGVPQDYEKAFEWYSKAAEQGYAEAQFYLGLKYFGGEGVLQSPEKAVEWFTKAAEQGYAKAQSMLVVLRRAEQGDAIAQSALGLVYSVGKVVPQGKMKKAAAMLKAIHAQEDKQAAREKAEKVADKLEAMKLKKAGQRVRDGIDETLSYRDFPREHHRHIYSNNMLENIMKQIRRRTRVVGAFPDGNSAVMLAAARLRHIAGTKWGNKRYMNMDRLKELKQEKLMESAEKVVG